MGLLSALTAREEVESLTLLYSRQPGAAGVEIDCWKHPKVHHVATRLRVRRWERWWRLCPHPSLQRLCGGFDVYHSLHHLMPPTAGRPRILTVHDLRRYRLPELYPASKTGPFERAVRSADRLIAVSNSTRRDLIELLGIDGETIDVVYHGTPHGFSPRSRQANHETIAALSKRFGRPIGGYAIVLGSPDRRKNLAATIRAFNRASRELGKDFCLLVVGNLAGDEDLQRTLVGSRAGERIFITGPVEDSEYRRLLGAARMMLFLSLYEGFGLPLLEAMACGVPLIASNVSSVPEIVGEAGLLVDPTDETQIARKIAELADNEELRSRLVTTGLLRASQFTWQRTAADTLACYAKAVTGQD
ncbi:MAG: glycosyltransferase family 4 protein [Planctomycetes bacterium]|nr:glycosyltransferase family 4 protein [Planctomycetota bacterium]